jgi:MATE family multidrug resistance protein
VIDYKEYKTDFRQNLLLAWPIMVGQLGQIAVNFIDNIMVGRLGPTPLASVSLAVSIYISLFVLGMGISFALPPLIAAANGAQEDRKISQFFKHSLVVNMTYALFSILFVEFIAIPLLPHLGQDPEVVQLAKPYLTISAWTMIPLMIFQTLRCYADGMSETKPAMIAIIIGNVLNIILNYMLIFGHWGAPKMGVPGAALGTLISRIVMIFLIISLLRKWKDLWEPIRTAHYLEYTKRKTITILKLGIPSGLQMFFEVSAFAGAAMIMGTLGAKSQAAHQIAINLASITFLICTGMGMAATIRVGNKLGKKDVRGIRNAGISALIQIIIFMALGAILFVLFRNYLPLIYVEDREVIEIAATLLILAALFQVSDGIQIVAAGALRGLQDVTVPFVITFISYWLIGLPISYLSAHYFDLGPSGIWMGLVIGLTFSAFLLTTRFLNRIRKMKSKML